MGQRASGEYGCGGDRLARDAIDELIIDPWVPHLGSISVFFTAQSIVSVDRNVRAWQAMRLIMKPPLLPPQPYTRVWSMPKRPPVSTGRLASRYARRSRANVTSSTFSADALGQQVLCSVV